MSHLYARPAAALLTAAVLLLAGLSGATPASAGSSAATPAPTSGAAPRPTSTGYRTAVPVKPKPSWRTPAVLPERPAGFVYRSGRNLMLDGEPYRFVGFNAYGMTGCATGKAWTQAELDTYFEGLPPAAMTRTWAFEHFGLEKLDLIVDRAEAHGQKLILSLTNQGPLNPEGDCGEFSKDAAWYQGGYRDSYLPWVDTVVERYKDSPAIGMWELINEPGHKAVTTDMIKAFFDTTAAAIKEIDPYHLVETGTQAEYTDGTGTAANFGLLHSGPDIDVGSLHEYDENHADQVISRHLAPTVSQMYALNKPLIIGETGINASPACAVTPQARAAMFGKEFDGYFLSGVAGVLVWNYKPSVRTDPARCDYEIRLPESDPTIGLVGGYTMPATVQAPTGAHLLQARGSGQCVQVPSSSTANGVVATQNTCAATAANQKFTLRPTTDGYYQLVAQHSGKCLDVVKESLALNALVQQWDCWEGANQQVRLEPSDGGYYRLIFRHSVKCLAVHTTGQIQQYDCKPGLTSQQWKIM